MPVFQPIVQSTPTPVGPSRPVNTNSTGILLQGAGQLFGAAANFIEAQTKEEQVDDPTQFEIENQALTQFQNTVSKANQVRQVNPKQAEKMIRQGKLRLVSSAGIDPSEDRVGQILELNGFEADFGIDKQVRARNAVRESNEYNLQFYAALAEGNDPEAADEIAIQNTVRNQAVDNAFTDSERDARGRSSLFLDRVGTATQALNGLWEMFVSTDQVPPQELFDQGLVFIQGFRAEAARVLPNADADTRASINNSLEILETMYGEFNDRFTAEELRQVNTKEWLSTLQEGLEQKVITPNQYKLLKTTFLNMDASSWQQFVSDTTTFPDLMSGMRALRSLTETTPLTDAEPEIRPEIATARQEVQDADIETSMGISQAMASLTSGDPSSVVNPERMKQVSKSLAVVANFIGKAADGDTFIPSKQLNAIFTDNFVKYYNEIATIDPLLATDLRNELGENIAKYNNRVNLQVANLEKEGFFVNEDNKLDIDWDSFLEAQNISEKDKNTFLSNFERWYPDTDSFLKDRGARIQRFFLQDSLTMSKEDLAIEDSILNVVNLAFRNDRIMKSNQWQAMLDSSRQMTERFDQFREAVVKIPPVTVEEVNKFSAMLPFIDQHEADGDYNALLGFTNRSGGQFSHIRVSQMTIDQVIEFQKSGGKYGNFSKTQVGRLATPAGRYQIVGETLKSLKRELKLSGRELFSPEMQDRMFSYLIKNRINKASTPEGRLAEVRKEWEGLKFVNDQELLEVLATF
jgi:hypothetical protein